VCGVDRLVCCGAVLFYRPSRCHKHGTEKCKKLFRKKERK
jgi:hypothetical protein